MFLTYPLPRVFWKPMLQLWSVGLHSSPLQQCISWLSPTVSRPAPCTIIHMCQDSVEVNGIIRIANEILFPLKVQVKNHMYWKICFAMDLTFQLNLPTVKTASLPSTAWWDTLGQGWQLTKTGLSFRCRSSLLLLTIRSQERLTANMFNMNTKFK